METTSCAYPRSARRLTRAVHVAVAPPPITMDATTVIATSGGWFAGFRCAARPGPASVHRLHIALALNWPVAARIGAWEGLLVTFSKGGSKSGGLGPI